MGVIECAYGYCSEKLYNREPLDNWWNLWICDECKITIQSIFDELGEVNYLVKTN